MSIRVVCGHQESSCLDDEAPTRHADRRSVNAWRRTLLRAGNGMTGRRVIKRSNKDQPILISSDDSSDKENEEPTAGPENVEEPSSVNGGMLTQSSVQSNEAPAGANASIKAEEKLDRDQSPATMCGDETEVKEEKVDDVPKGSEKQ